MGVDHVMNITDVDDKIIRNAVAEKQSLAEYTAIYEKSVPGRYRAALRLEAARARLARATEHIPEMAKGQSRS